MNDQAQERPDTEEEKRTESVEISTAVDPKRPDGEKPPARKSLVTRLMIAVLVAGALLTGWQGLLALFRSEVVKVFVSQLTPPLSTPVDEETLRRAREFMDALTEARTAVLAYRELHGVLPDLSGASFDMPSRRAFDAVTKGGKLSISAVTQGENTLRLVGVKDGVLKDLDFRLALAQAATSFSMEGHLGFRRFDGAPYDGRYASVYLPLDE